MTVYLTEGSISKISNGKLYSSDVKPVLQVTDVSIMDQNPGGNEDKVRYRIFLSDGYFRQRGMLHCRINKLVTSCLLQRGSIVQLIDFISNTVSGRTVILVFDLSVIIEKCDLLGAPKEYVLETNSKGPSLATTSSSVQSQVTRLGPRNSLPDSVSKANTKAGVVPCNQHSSKGPLVAVGDKAQQREGTNLSSYFRGSNVDSIIAEGSILPGDLSSMFSLSHEALTACCNHYSTLAQAHVVHLSERLLSAHKSLHNERARVEMLKNKLTEMEARRMVAESKLAAEKAAGQEEIAKLQVQLAKAIEEAGYHV